MPTKAGSLGTLPHHAHPGRPATAAARPRDAMAADAPPVDVALARVLARLNAPERWLLLQGLRLQAGTSRRSIFSLYSAWCFGCAASLAAIGCSLSLLSFGSLASVGSVGSVLSVGSVGSVLSVGCVGRVMTYCA